MDLNLWYVVKPDDDYKSCQAVAGPFFTYDSASDWKYGDSHNYSLWELNVTSVTHDVMVS